MGSNAASGLNILSNTPANTVTFQTLADGGDALSSSSGLDVATGKDYGVNGTSVLNATTLGSSVVTSSLTAVGTITTGGLARNCRWCCFRRHRTNHLY